MSQTPFAAIRGVAAPARRALASMGYAYLEQLDGVSEKLLACQHGMGPHALGAIKAALAERGMALSE